MRYVELRRHLQADYDNMLAIARLRDDVEAMTRHDLKGPLAGAIGIVQSLIDAADLDRRQLENLRLAEQAMLQVTDMVNLSTELYKIETGKYVLHAAPLPISDMLRRVVETARATYAGKQLVLAVDTDFDVGTDAPLALGDAMLTYSLLNNLIKNACEAAPERTRIIATLYAGSPLRIEIVNKGAIPEPIRERFFDKFVTDGKSGGTGLGTYSARLLARAQYGEVAFAVDDELQTHHPDRQPAVGAAPGLRRIARRPCLSGWLRHGVKRFQRGIEVEAFNCLADFAQLSRQRVAGDLRFQCLQHVQRGGVAVGQQLAQVGKCGGRVRRQGGSRCGGLGRGVLCRCRVVAQCGQSGKHRRQFVFDRRQQHSQFGFGYTRFACQFQCRSCRRHAFGADVAGGAAQGVGDPRRRCGVIALSRCLEILPQSGVAAAEAYEHAQVKVLPAHAGCQAGALVDTRELGR